VVADIPGIIEGAHEGKGLGLQFLRHIQRTRTLVFMVPVDLEDLQAQYDLLRAEIRQHSPALAEKPHCVVLTKADLVPPGEAPSIEAPEAWGQFLISSVTRQGLPELLEGLWQQAEAARRIEEPLDDDEGADPGRW
jgi:GTP-binding protein